MESSVAVFAQSASVAAAEANTADARLPRIGNSSVRFPCGE